MTCEVCEKNPEVGVACVPGVPYSAAYCHECLKANAHPYWVIVGNTCAVLDGYPNGDEEAAQTWRTHTAEWWQEMVDDTLKHLGKTEDQFKADVKESLMSDA